MVVKVFLYHQILFFPRRLVNGFPPAFFCRLGRSSTQPRTLETPDHKQPGPSRRPDVELCTASGRPSDTPCTPRFAPSGVAVLRRLLDPFLVDPPGSLRSQRPKGAAAERLLGLDGTSALVLWLAPGAARPNSYCSQRCAAATPCSSLCCGPHATLGRAWPSSLRRLTSVGYL